MSGLVSPSGAPLSQRKTREVVAKHQLTSQMLVHAFSAFLRLGFVGRMKWLFFGARTFKSPMASPTLDDVCEEARVQALRHEAIRKERPGVLR